MNKYIFIFFIASSITVLAQKKDTISIPVNKEGRAEYSDIVTVDSVNKDELYISVIEWFNNTYNNSKTVIQSSDKDLGVVIGKALTKKLVYDNGLTKEDGGCFSYVISVYCKDGKVKYVIDNIRYKAGKMMLSEGADLAEEFPSNWTGLLGNNKRNKKEWKSFQTQAKLDFLLITGSLRIHILQTKKKKDW